MSVSIRKLASEAGVSVATASRSMRGLAGVSPQTQKHVLETAQRIGYTRDPLLSSALSRARRSQQPIYKESIAFLAVNPPSKTEQRPWKTGIWNGLSKRASELGYKPERVTLPLKEKEQKQLIRQLHARGIRGLVLSPKTPDELYQLVPEWNQFSIMEIGHTLEVSGFPRVERLIHDDMERIFLELKTRGYQRIGLGFREADEAKRGWAALGAMLRFERCHPEITFCGALFEDGNDYSPLGLQAWIRKRTPDAIIVNGVLPYDWLSEAGWQLPKDLGLCRIDVTTDRPESGQSINYQAMGELAINHLTSILEHDTHAVNSPTAVIGIASSWCEGTTLRKQA